MTATPAVKAPGDETRQRIADAARDTRRKAEFLRRRPIIDQGEVYALAKEFFKAYLGKPFEYTADELQQELHRVYLSVGVRKRVEVLIEKISLVEYTDTQYSQAELQLMLEDLSGIVKELVTERKRHRPFLTRLADWLFRKRVEERRTVITDFPMLEPNDPVTVELNTLLERIYLSLEENDVKSAAKLYKRLLHKYNHLGSTVQREFYHKVNEAYEAIARQQA